MMTKETKVERDRKEPQIQTADAARIQMADAAQIQVAGTTRTARPVDTRQIVLLVLLDTADGKMMDVSLHTALNKLPGAEFAGARRFVSRLTRVTLERTITLDYYLNAFTKKKMKAQRPEIAWILRMAMAQLLYFDSVPESAAVNEAVKLAGRCGSGAKSFVNGTLRAMLRDRASWPAPVAEENFDNYLQFTYSVPFWIEQEVRKLSGEDREKTEDVLDGFLGDAPVFIRVNTAKITPDALQAKLMDAEVNVKKVLPNAFQISDFGLIEDIPGFKEGEFYVQDLSSIAAYAHAGFVPGGRVLDVCGAPGGKSINAALCMREGPHEGVSEGAGTNDRLGSAGSVLCCDASADRLARAQENFARLGLSEIRTKQRSGLEEHTKDAGQYDTVICDVPCSGLGDLRRKPDLKLHVDRKSSKELVPVQRKILSASFPAVKPGGRIIYSTCTILRAENQNNAAWFEKHFPVEKVFEKLYLPGKEWSGDGFYIAVFKRME